MNKPNSQIAIALLVNDADEILLGLRAPWKKVWPDYWDGIGGRVEAQESPAEALIREVREELGITPVAFQPLASAVVTSSAVTDPYELNLSAVFAWTDGDPANISDEHTEIRWFSFDAIRILPNLAGSTNLELLQKAIHLRRSPSSWTRCLDETTGL